jgi:hypothetical protein
MAKIHRIRELYIVDPSDRYNNIRDIFYDMCNVTETSMTYLVTDKVEVEWHDNINVNFSNCPIENYKKYLDE